MHTQAAYDDVDGDSVKNASKHFVSKFHGDGRLGSSYNSFDAYKKAREAADEQQQRE